MTTVGEPIEPEVWKWYHSVVGKGEAVIVDTWWQTETGGFLCSTVPAIHPMKPGSAGPGIPGIHPVIYDDEGVELANGSGKAGNICIRNPWPGAFQTIWKDPERYVSQYYSRYCRDPKSKDWRDWPYLAGDGAVQAADGYYRILGRIDDVINVAGHASVPRKSNPPPCSCPRSSRPRWFQLPTRSRARCPTSMSR